MHRKILRTTDLRPTQIIERELSKWKNTRILQEIPSSTSNDPHPSSPLATIDHIAVVEYDSHHRRLLFELTCSGETDVRKLCVHLGLKLGVGSTFEELRRTRSGTLSDMDSMVTLHTVKDGEQQYRTTGNGKSSRNLNDSSSDLMTLSPHRCPIETSRSSCRIVTRRPQEAGRPGQLC